MSENTKHAIYLLAILVLYGIAGRMDYDDQVAQEQEAAAHHMVAMSNGGQK